MTRPSSSPPQFRSPQRHDLSTPPFPELPEQSLISRLLITPLTLISFLISLCLIDSHNHSSRLRAHTHSPSRSEPTTFYGRAKAFLHSLFFKRRQPADVSPYAYVRNPGASASDGNIAIVGDGEFKTKIGQGETAKDEAWHWHTQQRKMMKAEVSDAFRIRKWVVAVLLIGGGGLFVMALVLLRWTANLVGRWLMSPGFDGRLVKDW